MMMTVTTYDDEGVNGLTEGEEETERILACHLVALTSMVKQVDNS